MDSPDHIAHVNPFRYRGYYYDAETEFYYIYSRYYDPEVGRFINADTSDLLSVQGDLYDKNLFAYCDANPTVRLDVGGYVWETVFDVVSLGASIVEVSINPSDPWAWAGLVGDVIDLVPFATGIGETVKITKSLKKATTVKDAAKKINDVSSAAKTTKRGWKVGDDITNLTRAGKDPSWSTVRQRYWKNQAYYAPYKFPQDISRMKKGLAPIGWDGFSMQLHHPHGRDGLNFYKFKPLTRTEHILEHKYRRLR